MKIFSIIYNENQKFEYEKYDNSSIKKVCQKSYLFEYNVLIDIIDNYSIQEKYLGIFSYKFPLKTGIFKKKLFKIIEQNPNYDIYTFCPYRIKLRNHYLSFTEKVHPGFLELFHLICRDLNLKVKEPNTIVYSNFFISKTEIYEKYVNEIIKPTIELLETKYKNLAWKDSNYKGLPKDQLKLYTELDYYPMFTFVLERLFNMYINNNSFKFKQLT